jgi:hypothetical protein
MKNFQKYETLYFMFRSFEQKIHLSSYIDKEESIGHFLRYGSPIFRFGNLFLANVNITQNSQVLRLNRKILVDHKAKFFGTSHRQILHMVDPLAWCIGRISYPLVNVCLSSILLSFLSNYINGYLLRFPSSIAFYESYSLLQNFW